MFRKSFLYTLPVSATLLLVPLALLTQDYFHKENSAKSGEARYDSVRTNRDSLPSLTGSDITAQQIREAVRQKGGVRIRSASIRDPLAISLEGMQRALILVDSVDFMEAVTLDAGDPSEEFVDSSRFLNLQFKSCRFHSTLELQHSFYNASFEECRMIGDVKVNGKFGNIDELWFNSSTFEGDVAFADLGTIHLLNLYDVLFKGGVDFFNTFVAEMNTTRIRADHPINIRWSQFGSGWLENELSWAAANDEPHRKEYVETGLMFWKQNFSRLGYERDERLVRFELIKFRRKFLSPSQVEWWTTSLLEFPSGFGTSPYRPLWLGLLIINIFAIIYWRKNAFVFKDASAEAARPSLLVLSLLYSLETFVPFFKVTGIKDWGCDLAASLKRVEWLERVAGVVIALLSAYSIGSYLI